ncbi:hypothetical protein ACWJKU_11325 [Methylocaldum sp. MU1018]
MKPLNQIIALSAIVLLAFGSGVRADSWGHGHRHGHHHHGHHHHDHYAPRVIEHYYEPAPYYYRQPRVVHRHYYQAPRVIYRDEYPVYRRHGGLSGALPIVAGGVLGGMVGEQAGYGNHGAIIAGSVAGAVLGHEIGH